MYVVRKVLSVYLIYQLTGLPHLPAEFLALTALTG